MQKDIDRSVQPKNNFFTKVPTDVLKSLFGLFTRHEQLCQLSAVSHQFRTIVEALVTKDLTQKVLELKSSSHQLPSYSKHQFFHASRGCKLDFEGFLVSDWSVAAFMGDEASLLRILGENYADNKDQAGRTVAHFGAYGGQLPFLKKLRETVGKDINTMKDETGFGCIHFAAMNHQFSTVQWLVSDLGLSLYEKSSTGGLDPLDAIADDDAPKNDFGTPVSRTVALFLAPLLCDKQSENAETRVNDLDALHEKLCGIKPCPPEFQGQDHCLEDSSVDNLIVAMVMRILSTKYVDNKKETIPFLAELVRYKDRVENEHVAVQPKFLI